MSKLLQWEKEKIRDLLVARVIDPKKADLKAFKRNLGMAVYNSRYTEVERDAMNALPQGWLPTWSHVGVYESANGSSGTVITLELEYPVRHPASDGSYTSRQADLMSYVVSDVIEAEERRKAIEKERGELSEAIIATLNSFSSHKQLRDGWPEAIDVIDAVLKPAGRPPRLPVAVSAIKALNTLLELPPEKS